MDRKVPSLLMIAGAAAMLIMLILSFALPRQYEIRAANCTIAPEQSVIMLPAPNLTGVSVEEAIGRRRSVRDFDGSPISQAELSQILWAAQGISGEGGKRSAPSAGALYPIELYVVPNRIEGISCGIYHYVPQEHKLVLHEEGNFTDAVFRSALSQHAVRDAAAVLIFTSVRERTASKYGDAADRYIAMEAGHISQNVLLESVSLGLGAVPIGAFDAEAMDRLLAINGSGESAVYINALGRPS